MYPEALESRLPPPRVPGSAGVRGSGRCCPPGGAPSRRRGRPPSPASSPGKRGPGLGEREAEEGEIIRQIPQVAGRAGMVPLQVMLSGRTTCESPAGGRGPGRPRLRPVLSLSLSPSGFAGGSSGFLLPFPPAETPSLVPCSPGVLLARAGPRTAFLAACPRPRPRPPAWGRPLLLLRPLRWGKPPSPGCLPLPAGAAPGPGVVPSRLVVGLIALCSGAVG